MPESFSIERRRLMKAYGAELELTPRELGMKGAIARANELQNETPKSWIPMQFDNPANVEAHRRTTAEEIAARLPRRARLHHHRRRHRRPHHRYAPRSSSRAGPSSRSSR